MKIIKTRTGEIFYDKNLTSEFLYVGDYGKENNIKSNFLGYENKIMGVKHKSVELSEKLVVTISTQKGCPMKCMFCDVPKFGYFGNASVKELELQVQTAILKSDCRFTERLNVHFARMGEPTFNRNVINYTKNYMVKSLRRIIEYKTIHPVVSTMLPKNNKNLEKFILDWF